MRQVKVKIGESWLVVNEKGQLCELVNLPNNVFKNSKGKILEFNEDERIEAPVNGLTGKFGSINFSFNKKSIDDELGW
jgi:hypothetical protein